MYWSNTNRQHFYKLYKFFKEHCAHWNCYTIIPRRFCEELCHILELFSSTITMLNVQKESCSGKSFRYQPSMLRNFLNNAHSLMIMTLPIQLIRESIEVDYGVKFRECGVLNIRIYADDQCNNDPATWLPETLRGWLFGLEYLVNIDVNKDVLTVQSMDEVNRIVIDFAHTYEQLFQSHQMPLCGVVLRIEGRKGFRGRFHYNYNDIWCLNVHVWI